MRIKGQKPLEINAQTSLGHLQKEVAEISSGQIRPCLGRYDFHPDQSAPADLVWKPLILLLGNYSTGKSTLVNEFLGQKVQETGLSPTDDGFTLITHTDDDDNHAAFWNEVAGPFNILKRHNSSLMNHFKIKKIAHPQLERLSIIDTPGMLDPRLDQDRPYNYHQVITDLCQIADLIVFLFDPHKTGAVKESCAIIESVLSLPGIGARILYVLNRLDDCPSLDDLVRVYGNVCWNLAQLTGRKDIPRILLCYAAEHSDARGQHSFLKELTNQRKELLHEIATTPERRLHLALHLLDRNISQLETLLFGYRDFLHIRQSAVARWSFLGMLLSLGLGISVGIYTYFTHPFGPISERSLYLGAIGLGLGFYLLWLLFLFQVVLRGLTRSIGMHMNELKLSIPATHQPHWDQIKEHLESGIRSRRLRTSSSRVKRDLAMLREIQTEKLPKWQRQLADLDASASSHVETHTR